MTLTIPQAGVQAGRSANIQIEADQTGAVLADFGKGIQRAGLALKAEQESRFLGNLKNRMMEGLNDLRLDMEQIGDPDDLETQFDARLGALREEYLGDINDPRLRDLASQTFDSMKEPHRFALGGRALDLRQGQWRVNLGNMGDQIVRAAAIADPDTQTEYLGQFAEELAEAVAQGILTPEEADRQFKARQAEADKARAERLLRDDPDALIDWIDHEGGLASLDADARERWKTRATSAINTRQRSAEAEHRAIVGEQLSDAIAARREGRVIEGEDALLEDPAAQEHARFQELVLRRALDEEVPDFRRLPLSEMRAARQAEGNRPVRGAPELLIAQAMDQAIEEAERAWAADPQGHYAALGLGNLPELPDIATASAEAFALALRTRAARAASIRDQGFTDDLVLFTPEERAELGEQLGASGNPAQRARAALAMATALGRAPQGIDAIAAAEEIGADPVFAYVGGLMAHGGTEVLARQIFEGQRIIANRDAPLPPLAQQRGEAFRAVRDVLSFGTDPLRGDADERALYDQITGAAVALYATRAAGDADFKDGRLRETDFLQALHEVMGGTGAYNSRNATGGIREVGGTLTILPLGVRAREVESGLRAVGIDIARTPAELAARTADAARAPGDFGGIEGLERIDRMLRLGNYDRPLAEETLRDLSVNGTVPQFGGQPMDGATWQRGRLRALGDGTYTLEFLHHGTGEVRIAHDETGAPWLIDMRKLIEAGRQ